MTLSGAAAAGGPGQGDLRNPPILLLDDALIAVDTQTESLILDALRTRHGRSTTLVIAHRLSTLMQADQIIVLDGGRVAQSGTHDELAGRAGPVPEAVADSVGPGGGFGSGIGDSLGVLGSGSWKKHRPECHACDDTAVAGMAPGNEPVADRWQ